MTDRKLVYADLVPVTVYKWMGITYVPHYTKPNVWVGPGYPRHTKEEWSEQLLIAIGAKADKSFLWSRPQMREAA